MHNPKNNSFNQRQKQSIDHTKAYKQFIEINKQTSLVRQLAFIQQTPKQRFSLRTQDSRPGMQPQANHPQKQNNPQTIIENQQINSPSSPGFQLLVWDYDHDEGQSASEKQTKKKAQKNVRKSIVVSMIEDDDIINDYFMASVNLEGENSITKKSESQEKQPSFKKQPEQEKSQHQSGIQKNSQNNQSLPKQLPQAQILSNNRQSTRLSPAKRGFHYQSAKITQQQQYPLPREPSMEININPSTTQKQPHTSRLLMQKEKYNLNFEQIYGEIFIYIAECELIGYNKVEYGYFLLTNYRVIFFKFVPEMQQTKKRVDLPFGFAKNLECFTKRKEIVFYLHYDHYWKFYFENKQDFDKIRLMLDLYAKTKGIKSSFAFDYALRVTEFHKFNFDILKEYIRMRLSDVALVFPNEGFKLSQTYPLYICLPQQMSSGSRQVIKSICQNFKGNRLPVLTFRFGNGEDWAGLWLSGTYVEDSRINEKQLKTYFSYMRGQNKKRNLFVYDCYYKSAKVLVESTFDKRIENRWLNLPVNSQIKTSYEGIAQAYLIPKKTFFTDVIGSKWYDLVMQFLKSSFQIAQKLMGKEPVLIKEDDMREKQLIVSALVQIILQPFYRTFKGFKYLIMKEFICFGYRFASRLGNRQTENSCPTFVLFLDIVSQLFHLNPLYFEFNSKYLGKISNLMYTNIFGTFLADSPKQFFQSEILQKTVQIWSQLESQLTKNPFYEIKNGIVTNTARTTSDLRFWSEHFGFLTGQPKDVYKMHPSAQSTGDYVPLECLRIKTQNTKLKSEVQKQRNQILRLKEVLKSKNLSKNQVS